MGRESERGKDTAKPAGFVSISNTAGFAVPNNQVGVKIARAMRATRGVTVAFRPLSIWVIS